MSLAESVYDVYRMRYVLLWKISSVIDVRQRSRPVDHRPSKCRYNEVDYSHSLRRELYDRDELVSSLKKQIQDLNAVRATVTVIVDFHFRCLRHMTSN